MLLRFCFFVLDALPFAVLHAKHFFLLPRPQVKSLSAFFCKSPTKSFFCSLPNPAFLEWLSFANPLSTTYRGYSHCVEKAAVSYRQGECPLGIPIETKISCFLNSAHGKTLFLSKCVPFTLSGTALLFASLTSYYCLHLFHTQATVIPMSRAYLQISSQNKLLSTSLPTTFPHLPPYHHTFKSCSVPLALS